MTLHIALNQRLAYIAATAVLAAAVPLAAPGAASAATVPTPFHSTASPIDFASTEADMTAALSLVASIPDSVLAEGDEATRQWMLSAAPETTVITYGNVWACTAAIAALIATTAIPVAKLLKIKKLISAGGGVVEIVKTYWGASFSYEKIRAIGGAAGALALEIIGITAVKKGCF